MPQSDPVESAFKRLVQEGEMAGAAALAWRDGQVSRFTAAGWRNIEQGLPITRETIFRIASMTKPVTSLLALRLLELGRFALEDPITRYAPEFAHMRVLDDPAGALSAASSARRPITFEDLLTHRAGLTYGDFERGPIAKAYADALGADLDSHVSSNAWIAGLAALPLIDHPGETWRYGRSSDLLGLLIARMEDRPLGDVMRTHLFDPLGMQDTGFAVPPSKRDRRAVMYGFDTSGRLEPRPGGPDAPYLPDRPESLEYQSGGQGLWSTVDDYLAFARLFIGSGSVDGVRILEPRTLELMTTNRLSDAQRSAASLLGRPVFSGHGFGLGLAVVLDPERADPMRCRGAAGTVGWPGAFGGWWQADPQNQTVLVFMAQNALDPARLAEGIGLGVYAALSEFQSVETRGAF